MIPFISKEYVGHVSDKVITEENELCNSLICGNNFLADCGFTIPELIAEAKLKISAFTNGKT